MLGDQMTLLGNKGDNQQSTATPNTPADIPSSEGADANDDLPF